MQPHLPQTAHTPADASNWSMNTAQLALLGVWQQYRTTFKYLVLDCPDDQIFKVVAKRIATAQNADVYPAAQKLNKAGIYNFRHLLVGEDGMRADAICVEIVRG